MKTIPDLTKKHCTPSEKAGKTLTVSQLKTYLAVVPHWTLAADRKCIRRKWVVKDFLIALDFFNRVGRIAQAEDHHPDLHLKGYRKVTFRRLFFRCKDCPDKANFILRSDGLQLAPMPGPATLPEAKGLVSGPPTPATPTCWDIV
jgi:4a-hydroxytetrahydrobiopterin dehydratase